MAQPCRLGLLLLLLVLLLAAPSVLHGFLLPPGNAPLRPPPRLTAAAAGPTDGFEPSERTPETLRAFAAWLRSKGGLDLSQAPVALHLDPHSRSITLTTTRPIEKEQIVLAVPSPLLLTSTTTLPPALAAAAEAADLDCYGRLALRLLAEAAKGEEGEWWPYLQVLPRRGEMHLPVLWDDLLPLLAPSPLHDDVTECRAAFRAELESLRAALTLSQSQQGEKGQESVLRLLDWGRWTWARAIAMSRPYLLDPKDDNAAAASLTLIPVVDMADHCDEVRYAVQRGDGVFTARSDMQLVADRAYPTPGQPFWNTYGPGLSSASKLYSFGYLETLSLDGEGGSDASVPLQGTALFVVGLKEDDEDDEPRHAKTAVLASVGLAPKAQRVEVATRLRLTTTDTGLVDAMVAIEDQVTAPELVERAGGEDGGLERLLRYLRLKHIPASGLTRLLGDVNDGGGVWDRLASDRCCEWVDADVEVAAALEAVALCREGLRRVGPQWRRADEAGEGNVGKVEGYRHRLRLVRTLLHGEVLALRAVAEACMEMVEAAEGRGRRSID